MPVVLYDIPQRIIMIQRSSGSEPVNNWDREMDLDNADFRIYKGVDNRIEFLLRNTDRKAVPLMGRTVRIVFRNRHTGQVLADPLVEVVNEQKGSCVLILEKALTQDWPEGALQYSALVEDPEGHQFLLFADHNQRATAYCYVTRSPVEHSRPDPVQVYHFPLMKANATSVRRIQLVKDGVGFDTAGYTFEMQIRTSQSPSADVLQTLNANEGGLTAIDEQNNVYLEMKIGPFPGVTSRITAYYDLVATKTTTVNGVETTHSTVWLEGTLPIEPGVTY